MKGGSSLSEVLVDYLRESGLEQSVLDVQIEEVWPRVMGETVRKLNEAVGAPAVKDCRILG